MARDLLPAPGGLTVLSYLSTVERDLPTVALSVVIAILATHVSFELAARKRWATDSVTVNLWSVAGALAMGTGFWAVHFVAMAAVSYPFAAGYLASGLALSWGVAVAVSGVFLRITAQAQMSQRARWGHAVVCGLGMGTMPFIGLEALVVLPRATYDWQGVFASMAFAIGGARLAVEMHYRMRDLSSASRRRVLMTAALLAAVMLCGMSYSAIGAIRFAPSSVSPGTGGLAVEHVGDTVGFAVVAFLLYMTLINALERRGHRVASKLNQSLLRTRESLHYVTFNDAATGLPNRLLFQDRLQLAVAQTGRQRRQLAVMLVELDRFGDIVRRLPDVQADALLRQVGTRLCAVLDPAATVASVGRGQFMLLLPEVDGLDDAVRAAEQLVQAMQLPLLDERRHDVVLSASVGVAMHPTDGPVDRLTSNASVAAAWSREQGGNRYSFFHASMDREAQETSELLHDLRGAIGRGELELFYQPKVHAKSGQIAGVEALLRWRHPVRGLVSPALFVPLAERFGLIGEIGSWVIEDACRQMGEWTRAGIRMRVAINVSVHQLRQDDLAGEITAALKRHGVSPRLLTCEVTESGAMENTEQVLVIFKSLQAAGVQISIDDFGTGYSSLAYLRKLPVRQLKVDRSFVADLGASEDARLVVAAVIELAHALRLEVVAEGVETAVQQQVLLELGVDKFQGFLFAKPMPAAQLTGLAMSRGDAGAREFRQSLYAEL